jgi:hypothetical protein
VGAPFKFNQVTGAQGLLRKERVSRSKIFTINTYRRSPLVAYVFIYVVRRPLFIYINKYLHVGQRSLTKHNLHPTSTSYLHTTHIKHDKKATGPVTPLHGLSSKLNSVKIRVCVHIHKYSCIHSMGKRKKV